VALKLTMSIYVRRWLTDLDLTHGHMHTRFKLVQWFLKMLSYSK